MPLRTCRRVLDQVSTIIDGEAGVVAKTRFFGHLKLCGKCKDYFEQFKVIRDAAGVVQPEDLPSDFDDVMTRILGKLGCEPDAASK